MLWYANAGETQTQPIKNGRRVPDLAASGQPADAPEWLGCDLVACRVLEEASAQIAAKCRTPRGVNGTASSRKLNPERLAPPTADVMPLKGRLEVKISKGFWGLRPSTLFCSR